MKSKIFALVFASYCLTLVFPGNPVTAQTGNVLSFVNDDGVHLRWKAERQGGLTGYIVSRRQDPGGEWTPLTASPIQRISAVAALRAVLGYQTEMFLKLFDRGNPPRDIDDGAFQKLVNDKNSDAFLSLMSAANARIAEALGELYVDHTADRSNVYRYRVTAVAAAGERVIGESGPVRCGTIETVPIVNDFTASISSNTVALHWKRDGAQLISGRVVTCNVYRADSLLGEYVLINTAPILPVAVSAGARKGNDDGMESFVDRFLDNGHRYFYHLKAVNAFGIEGEAGLTVEATPGDTSAPGPPSQLRATQMGATALLEWVRSRGSASAQFRIYTSDSEKDPFVLAAVIRARIDAAVQSWVDPGIREGESRYYHVTAVSADGHEGTPSDIASVRALDLTPPVTPREFSAKAEKGKIVLRWTANAEPDLDGYILERASDESFSTRFLLSGKPLLHTQFTDTVPIAIQSTFGYLLYAVDRNDNRSAPTVMLKVRTYDKTAPLPPFITSLKIDGNTVEIAWTGNTEDDFVHYALYRSSKDSLRFARIATPRENRCTDSLASFGKYYYAVSAIDSLGNESIRSRAVPVTRESDEAPHAPGKGSASVKGKDLVLVWEKSSSVSVVAYVLARKRADNGDVQPLGEVPSGTLTFIDKDARRKTGYTYLIRARDAYWRMSEVLEVTYEGMQE